MSTELLSIHLERRGILACSLRRTGIHQAGPPCAIAPYRGERDEFLRQYHQAVDAAHDPAGYQQLRRLLHVWSLTAIATGQPGYYEELAAAQAGTTATLPITDAIPDWTERAAAARNRK